MISVHGNFRDSPILCQFDMGPSLTLHPCLINILMTDFPEIGIFRLYSIYAAFASSGLSGSNGQENRNYHLAVHGKLKKRASLNRMFQLT